VIDYGSWGHGVTSQNGFSACWFRANRIRGAEAMADAPRGGSNAKRTFQFLVAALAAVLCVVNVACSGLPSTPGGGGSASGGNPPPPPNVTVVVSPPEVQGGQSALVTVNLSSAAPATGLTVMLTVDNPQAVVLPNPTVMIAGGTLSVTFPVNTSAVTVQATANIIAAISVNGQTASGNAALKVDATTSAQVQSVALGPPSTVQGAQSVPGMVTLTQAPMGPAVVQLASSAPTVATFASNAVSIAAGQTTGTFTVSTATVTTPTAVTITAALNGTAAATLNVNPLQVMDLTIAPGTVTGGQSATGTVTLGGPAAAGGTTVSLSSTGSNAVVPISVTIPAGSASGSFVIRSNPTSAQTTATVTATLNSSAKTGTLTINPPVVSGVVVAALGLSPSNVSSGQTATVTVTLTANAPAGGVVVNLTSSNPGAFALPASVTIAPNTSLQSFMVTAGAVGTPTQVTLTASSGSTSVIQGLTVLPPPVVRVSFIPATVIGGSTSTGTVTVNLTAPGGGVFVSLSSSDPTVVVPAGVTVPAGSTSASFTATTTAVAAQTTATVSASSGASLNISASLTVVPPSIVALTLSPGAVTGGTGSLGMVILSGPAPAGGSTISVVSSDTTLATVPATFVIAAGQSSGTFNVSTLPTASGGNVNITASAAGSAAMMAGLTVNPPVLTRVTISPSNVASGQMVTGTVVLSGPAPAGGLTVGLMSSNASLFPVPASAVVAAGATSQNFMVTAGSVGTATSVTVTATSGISVVTTNVTIVVSDTISSVSVSPTTVTGGTSSTVTVTLSQPAPSGGITIGVGSSDPTVTVPAIAVFPQGTTTQTFTATTTGVATTKNVSVSAALGTSFMTATLTVNPAALMSLTLSPTFVTGGTGSVGTLVLSGPAPPSGLTVTLMSSNTSAATVPASFNIAGGASSGTFNVTTLAVSAGANVNITATLPSGASSTVPMTVVAPVVVSLSFMPTNAVMGQVTTGTVTLTGPAPAGGLQVTLHSGNTTALPVPANVTVAANSTSQTFSATAGSVTTSTNVAVTAMTSTTTVTGNITILPALTVQSVTFSPSGVTGGTSSTGTVTLSQNAPAGGLMVSLSSGDPSVTVPGLVTVLANRSTQTFTATTTGVAAPVNAQVFATLGTSNASGNLAVNPATISSFTFTPSSVTGGNASQGKVTLNGPAPAAGLTVTLMSSNTAALTVPANFSIAGAATSGTFNVTSSPVAASTPVTVTATLPSGSASGGGVTVLPPVIATLAFSPSNVAFGQMTTGTATLNGTAPTGGTNVGLTSGDPPVAPVPGSVTVAVATNSKTFSVTAGSVSTATPVTVTATTGTTSVMGMLTVVPALTANPGSLTFTGTQITLTTSPNPVVLTNNSGSAVPISGIATSGDFGQTNNCPASLAGLATCTINVTFTPTQGGSRGGNLTVTSGANQTTVALSGTGFHWVSLTWSECTPGPSCPAVNNFNVYRQMVASGTASCPTTGYGPTTLNPSPIPYSTSPTYADIGLTAGATFCYAITALNAAGESAFSAPTSPIVIPSP